MLSPSVAHATDMRVSTRACGAGPRCAAACAMVPIAKPVALNSPALELLFQPAKARWPDVMLVAWMSWSGEQSNGSLFHVAFVLCLGALLLRNKVNLNNIDRDNCKRLQIHIFAFT